MSSVKLLRETQRLPTTNPRSFHWDQRLIVKALAQSCLNASPSDKA